MNGFDFANIGQMFGPGMGATPTGLDALLNEEQRRLLGRNAALSAAAALLQAGGPSRTPINLGQALGSALQAGQQGYQQARAGALQDVMLGEKLKEAQMEREARERYRQMLTGGGAPAGLTPAQAALAAPVSAVGPVGPTTARAELAAQMPQPAPTLMQSLTPEQRALLGSMTPKQGIPELLKMSSAMTEFGEPKPFVIDGKTVMVQTNKMGQTRVVPNVMPYEAQSQDIRAVEYITGKPLAGTGAAGIKDVGQYRQQIAPKTQVDVKLPGNQQFLAGVGTDISQTLSNLTAGARVANETLARVDQILPALDKAVLGPGADYRTTMLRVGQQLGVAGQNANEVLAKTATVVQGLAQGELDAAAQMKGQGALTEAERAILRRAAGGDQTLTSAEIQVGLKAAQKSANARLKLQREYVERARKLPGFEQFAPLYEVTPYGGSLVNQIDDILRNRRSP